MENAAVIAVAAEAPRSAVAAEAPRADKRQDTFGEYHWTVRSYECGPDSAATVANICNYLQEAASVNAEELGFSKVNFDADGKNITWVLARMKVAIARRPNWNERVSVLTYPRGGRRIVAARDFVLTDAAGADLVRATSEWMVIDLTSRRPLAIPEGVFDLANTARAPALGTDAPWTPRLRWPENAAPDPAPYVVRAAPSDIDMNGHVNNVRYITWIFDACITAEQRVREMVPESRPESCDARGASAANMRELEIVFRSEALCGDEIVCERTPLADGKTMVRLRSRSGQEHVLALLG